MRTLKRKSVSKIAKEAAISTKIYAGGKEPERKRTVDFIDSGCTMLNLAASGRGRTGGHARGRIVNIVGDNSAGKTIVALEAAANAFYKIKKTKSKNFPKIKKVIIVFNNVEGVMDFPLEAMYGAEFVKAVEWIRIGVVEECGRDFFRRLKKLRKGEFLLYIIDSWDALVSFKGKKRTEKAVKENVETKDGYHLEQQAYASQEFFPMVCEKMEKSSSKGKLNKKDATLFIISQTRKKIGITFGDGKYRRGGDALNFYTHQVGWLRVVTPLRRKVRGREVAYGIKVEIKYKRNKVAPPFRIADVNIIFGRDDQEGLSGIDDVGSMIDWYFGVKEISMKEVNSAFSIPVGKIKDTDKDKKVNRDRLITHVEKNDLEEELKILVENEWEKIEKRSLKKRKRKF